MDTIDEILKTIDDAISTFQDRIPGLQKLIFEDLQPLIKDLKTQNGKILNNVENLRLLGKLKNKLQKIIISPEYKDAVENFIKSYDAVATLNISYFREFNKTFTPVKTLPIIKELAIESTINDLVGQGMNVNVVDAVSEILKANITTGGSYAGLSNNLRDHILGNDKVDGSLARYSKQITVDAINQYHAQYHAAIGQDLDFTWGRYVGSLLTTSREFCILLTKKQWVNKSELPEIIKGHIDGHSCRLSKSTGLPIGMIPGTNADNFKINRGGYQCGHHYFEVPDSAVPENVKNKPSEIQSKFVDVKKIKAFAGDNINLKILDKLTGPVDITISKSGGSYYNPNTDEIVFDENRSTDSSIHKEMVVYHEFGHALHDHNDVITPFKVRDDFNKAYNSSRKAIKPNVEKTMADTQQLLRGSMGYVKDFKINEVLQKYDLKSVSDLKESISIVYDIVGALTKGQYGGGHSVKYYKSNNGAYAELFAHGNYLSFSQNKLVEEKLPEVVEILREYFKDFHGQ